MSSQTSPLFTFPHNVHVKIGTILHENGQRPWSTLKDVCALLSLPVINSHDIPEILFQHMLVKAGQRVYCAGQQFEKLYLVHSGFLKTISIGDHGGEVVLGFPMKGDLLGVDGIHSRLYATEAVALSDCDLLILPFKNLVMLGRQHDQLENLLYHAISRELSQSQMPACIYGPLCAEAKVARFLAGLADRFAKLGYSSRSFNLRMTRQEIGSYLGLSLETVSRTLSALNSLGLISVKMRAIDINEYEALRAFRRLPPSFFSSRNMLKKSIH